MDRVKIFPWPETQAPSEAGLRRLMAAQRLRPYRWSNGPGDRYAPHRHGYHKVIYVVRGAIEFELPEAGERCALAAGDRLDLPAGILHGAHVGPQGVVCLEAHC